MAKDRRKKTSVIEKLNRAQVLPKCNKACPPLGGPNFIVGGGGGGEGEGEEGGDDELSPRRTLRVLLLLLLLLELLLMLDVGRGRREAACRVGAATKFGAAAPRLLPAAAASLRSPQLVIAPLLILPIIVPVSSVFPPKDCEWGAEKRRAIHLSSVTILSAHEKQLAVSLKFWI